ncbi:unnamed protein product [Cercospora beticola]|nr:unnamed protein product [Cercospora beticola]
MNIFLALRRPPETQASAKGVKVFLFAESGGSYMPEAMPVSNVLLLPTCYSTRNMLQDEHRKKFGTGCRPGLTATKAEASTALFPYDGFPTTRSAEAQVELYTHLCFWHCLRAMGFYLFKGNRVCGISRLMWPCLLSCLAQRMRQPRAF